MEEEHFRRVEFGMASLQLQRRHSLSCQTEEIRPIDALSSGILCREKPRRCSTSSWRLPEAEMPAMPEQAMEFLSRTWSTCSSELLQILSPASTSRLHGMLLGPASSSAPEDGEPAEASKDEEKNTVRLQPGRGQSLLDGTRVQDAVMARGTPRRPPLPRRNKLTQPTCWLNGGHMWAVLRGFLLSAVSITGSQRRRRRRDELRLHAAQAHAAVSVAQLAGAVAGMVSAYELRPPQPPPAAARGPPADPVAAAGDSRSTGAVLASAAALVATVCAEAAAESGRVDAARVASAVRAGRESRSTAELLALTATAATSLRGAAALELRAADVRGIGSTNNPASVRASLQKGTTLRVCLPCGRVRMRTVAIFPHGTVVVLRLGKNLLRGAFITYQEYEVLAVSGGAGSGGEAVVEGRPFFPLALSTMGGPIVQLLFEHQMHCKVWTTSVQEMFSEHKLKHPMN